MVNILPHLSRFVFENEPVIVASHRRCTGSPEVCICWRSRFCPDSASPDRREKAR
jgi:hypothetical protein